MAVGGLVGVSAIAPGVGGAAGGVTSTARMNPTTMPAMRSAASCTRAMNGGKGGRSLSGSCAWPLRAGGRKERRIVPSRSGCVGASVARYR